MNTQAYKYGGYDEDEDDIPNEFSENEYEHGGRDSENFAPRASISSRGSRIEQKSSAVKPINKYSKKEYMSEEELKMSPGAESSNVEEIVEHQVVELTDEKSKQDQG